MRILLTNDDGIRAPGMESLARVAKEFGEVKIAAPDRERSACAHAMTLREPLRVHEGQWYGVTGYEINGVPVDCVNVGLTLAWPDGCDLVLSGINYGPNLGFDITYSGTAAGAMEGTINGIRSIAFSLAMFVLDAPAHWETAEHWIRENLLRLAQAPLDPLTFWNVNIPSVALPELRGHKVVPMGQRVYKDRVECRLDPWNRPYYWQGGATVLNVDQPGTDVDAARNGFVSVTPVSLDWTSRKDLGAF